jgi:hypothetical protein
MTSGMRGRGRIVLSRALCVTLLTSLSAGAALAWSAPARVDAAEATFQQEGPALFAQDQTHDAELGRSVALSADGSTALVGGLADNGGIGGAWVYTRSGPGWVVQGAALTPDDASGAAYFGASVALSADGNTAVIGGWDDNDQRGAAWIFARSGSTWTQQGSKLLPRDPSPNGPQILFGVSVALSADGNTALIGGDFDNYSLGAAWVFTRSGSTWSQQGAKLTAAGEVPGPDGINSAFGASVALSSDGNTALIGGPHDDAEVGAAWMFTRTGTTWTQGPKLTGSGEEPPGSFGASAALAADGQTALVGGGDDAGGTGAAWVFARDGSSWTQQGPKLMATDETGPGEFGDSVSLSSSGNAALIGADDDDTMWGAAWVFDRTDTTWAQQGPKLTAAGGYFGYATAISADGQSGLIGNPGYNTGYGGDTGAAWAFGLAAPTGASLALSAYGGREVFGQPAVGSVELSDFSDDLGLADPTGSITVDLYGPDAQNCDGPPTATATVSVSGEGIYQTGPVPITQTGTYQQAAYYSGDANDYPAASGCYPSLTIMGDVEITPSIAQSVRVGTPIHVNAAVAGAVDPTGSVTFNFYGPTSQNCGGPPEATQTLPLTGNGTLSLDYIPDVPGTYHMTATYPGDGRNYSAAITCDDAGSAVAVQPAAPAIVSNPTSTGSVGSSISDAVQVVGGFNPTGAVAVSLFPPPDATCAGTPVATVTADLVDGGASSGGFATTTAGRYRFVVAYAGDANNLPVTSACGSAFADVAPRSPTLSAAGSWSEGAGGTISDTVTIHGGFGPTGSVTFLLYGPGDLNCHGGAAFKAVVPVANGGATAGPLGPVSPGVYEFASSYGGDANNAAAALACGRNEVAVPAAVTRLTVSELVATPAGITVRMSCVAADGTVCRGVVDVTAREVRRHGRVVVVASARTRGSRQISLAHSSFGVAASHASGIGVRLNATGRRLRRDVAKLPIEVTVGLDGVGGHVKTIVKESISLNRARSAG